MLLPLAAVVLAQSLSMSVSVAPRLEQFRYRFENPSNIDGSGLVPHFFEQRYDVVPVWLAAEADYALGGIEGRTTAGLSLRGQRHGSDIDTFALTSGDVATSGTDGDVMLRSWAISQRFALDTGHGWSIGFTATYRRDQAEFLPADRIVTHSIPPSISREFITDRESTVSQVIGLGIDAEHTHAIGRRWRLRYGVGVQPLILGTLLVQLPDKYPGVDLSFTALSGGATGSCSVERRIGGWHVGIAISATGARGYAQSRSYSSRNITFAGFVGR